MHDVNINELWNFFTLSTARKVTWVINLLTIMKNRRILNIYRQWFMIKLCWVVKRYILFYNHITTLITHMVSPNELIYVFISLLECHFRWKKRNFQWRWLMFNLKINSFKTKFILNLKRQNGIKSQHCNLMPYKNSKIA